MILVTGATGHLGNVLVQEFINRGQKVRALLLPGEDRTPLNGIDVELVEADVLDYSALHRAFRGVQDVYHLAGLISILPGEDKALRLVNILGTRNVIHAARDHGVRRLLYTSSIHALSRVPHGITIDENIPYDPQGAISAYDQSKALASLEVLSAAKDGLNAVIACPTGIIGPRDFRPSEMGQLILDCINGKPQLYVEGAYDFVDVRDVAQGLIQVSEHGKVGESYILSGEYLTVRRLLDTIQAVTGRRIPSLKIPLSLAKLSAPFAAYYYGQTKTKPRFTPYSLETLRSNSRISHEKASRKLGYSPRPLQESIADTIDWFTDNGN